MNRKEICKLIAVVGVVGTISVVGNTTTVEATESNISNNSSSVVINSTGQVVNVTTNLKIRESASTDSEVLGNIIQGTVVDIISKENEWYKISWNSIIGYVHSDYIEEISREGNESRSGNGQVVNVTTNLRVRSSASTNSDILGYLLNNETINVIERKGDWYKIKYGEGYGYVHKDYVKTDISEDNSSEDEYENIKLGYVYNVESSSLRVRSKPTTESSILGALYQGETVSIIGESGNWFKIKYNNSSAYVSKDYIRINQNSESENSSEMGQVINITTNLRVRENPSTNSKILGYLLNGEKVQILEKQGTWYKIKFGNSVGYVSESYITTNISNDETNSKELYDTVFNAMKKHIGSPYVWGGAGESLTSNMINEFKRRFPNEAAEGLYNHSESYANQGYLAFDCSGLMQWGFRQAGINIGRTTYNQIHNGVEVGLHEVKEGDLLFNKSLGHVGMYVGNGQWIESPKSGEYILITDVPWSEIGRARRIL